MNRVSTNINSTTGEPSIMDQLMKEFTMPEAPRRNKLVTGEVVAETREGFSVNLGLKADSVVPHSEADGLKIGDSALFFVMSDADEDGACLLSYVRASRWSKAQGAKDSQETVEAQVISVARPKGNVVGLNIRLNGLDGFNPRSELELRGSADELVGKTILVKVIEADPFKGRRGELIVSNAQAVVEVQTAEIAKLEKGAKISGTVSKLIEAGALVDIGNGITALAHKSELSDDRSAKPSDVVKKGDVRTFEIVNVDPTNRKVSLSLKNVAQEEYLNDLDSQLKAAEGKGVIVTGTVARSIEYGTFVRLGGCIDGFLHISELAGKKGSKETLDKGTEVEVKVINVDVPRKRIALSRKGMAPATVTAPAQS